MLARKLHIDFDPRFMSDSKYDVFSTAKPKTIHDLPEKSLERIAVKLYIIGSLVWDYTESVLDLASYMNIEQTRKVSRKVRETKRLYEQFKQRSLDGEDIEKERQLGLLFEEIIKPHLDKLSTGLKAEIRMKYDLDDDNMFLVEAVQTAMTMLDAMRLYAKRCDEWIASQGVKNASSVLQYHIHALAILLPQFAGDCYDKDSYSRRTTATIIFNEVVKLELYDENGIVM